MRIHYTTSTLYILLKFPIIQNAKVVGVRDATEIGGKPRDCVSQKPN